MKGNCSTTFRNIAFMDIVGGEHGGALYLEDNAHGVTDMGCQFTNCTADYPTDGWPYNNGQGGAVYATGVMNMAVVSADFDACTAGRNGGVSTRMQSSTYK